MKKDWATETEIRKPICIVEYNGNMSAVDKSDMLLSSTECIRKSMKWYKKVFFHLLNCTVLNCYGDYRDIYIPNKFLNCLLVKIEPILYRIFQIQSYYGSD